MEKPRTFRELALILRSRKLSEPKQIRNAYSATRRTTVEDVFWQAGKIRKKDGKWMEGPVTIIGSGLGGRIYPPRPPREPPKYHPKELLWVQSLEFDGALATELRCVEEVLAARNLKGKRYIAFWLGKNDGEFCRIVKRGGKTFWEYRDDCRY